MENEQGTSPKGEVAEVAQLAQPETTDTIPDETPQTKSVEEFNALQAQLADTQAKLADVTGRRANENNAITRLAQERDTALAQVDGEYTRGQMKLVAKDRAGTLDEAGGNLAQQLERMDTEYESKRQAIIKANESAHQYTEHANAQMAEISKLLEGAGLSMTSSDPAVLEVQAAWNEAINSGKPLDSVVTKASLVAIAKVKAAQPDITKLEEALRVKIREEQKQSPVFKTDTGGVPAGSISNNLTSREKIRAGWDEIHPNE